MKCPKCKKKAKASATRFIEYSHAQRRIRTCECGFKFITHEVIEPDKQDLGQHSKQKKKKIYKQVLLELITDLGGRTYFEKRKNSPWERQFYKRVLNILIDDLEEKQKPENKEDFKIWEGV